MSGNVFSVGALVEFASISKTTHVFRAKVVGTASDRFYALVDDGTGKKIRHVRMDRLKYRGSISSIATGRAA